MKCKNCTRLFKDRDSESENYGLNWCDKIFGSPDVEEERDCPWYKPLTHGDMIRRMTDKELAAWIFRIDHYRDDGEWKVRLDDISLSDNKVDILEWLKSEAQGDKI